MHKKIISIIFVATILLIYLISWHNPGVRFDLQPNDIHTFFAMIRDNSNHQQKIITLTTQKIIEQGYDNKI